MEICQFTSTAMTNLNTSFLGKKISHCTYFFYWWAHARCAQTICPKKSRFIFLFAILVKQHIYMGNLTKKHLKKLILFKMKIYQNLRQNISENESNCENISKYFERVVLQARFLCSTISSHFIWHLAQKNVLPNVTRAWGMSLHDTKYWKR